MQHVNQCESARERASERGCENKEMCNTERLLDKITNTHRQSKGSPISERRENNSESERVLEEPEL